MAATAANHPIHFVGSVPLPDTEAVFRAFASSVGARAKRWPDGETGDRTQWIRWQRKTFDDNPAFELRGKNVAFAKANDSIDRPIYVLRDGRTPADVTLGPLGYAAAARNSYETFARLKADGIVPEGVRFQVSMPSAVALATGFIDMSQRAEIEPLIEAALFAEAAEIAATIPAGDLAIQWDVCHEVLGADGGVPVHYGSEHDAIIVGSAERAARHLAAVPDSVEAGIHLCYGDPGHKHIIEPADLATCVAMANAICAASPRPVDFIHMPVPRERDDDAYFAPLADLALPAATELYLGLVHFTGGLESTRARLAVAARHAGAFGIATECGFGRRDPATIEALLGIHVVASGG